MGAWLLSSLKESIRRLLLAIFIWYIHIYDMGVELHTNKHNKRRLPGHNVLLRKPLQTEKAGESLLLVPLWDRARVNDHCRYRPIWDDVPDVIIITNTGAPRVRVCVQSVFMNNRSKRWFIRCLLWTNLGVNLWTEDGCGFLFSIFPEEQKWAIFYIDHGVYIERVSTYMNRFADVLHVLVEMERLDNKYQCVYHIIGRLYRWIDR